MLNCLDIDQLDIDSIDITYPKRSGPHSTRLSLDIEDSMVSSFAFLSPKATSIAHHKSFVSPFDESMYTRFKSKIIEDKLTDNKKLHLHLRDQDEMIDTLKEQIENRSVMSFQSRDSMDVSSTQTLNKLRKIQKDYLEPKKAPIKKNVKRYRIEKRCQPQQEKQNMVLEEPIQFTAEELECIKGLNPALQLKLTKLKGSQNHLSSKCKQFKDINQRLQSNNRLYSRETKQLKQKILSLQSDLEDMRIRNDTLHLQNQQLSARRDQQIERERFRCLYELDCQYSKEQSQLIKLGV